MPVLYEKVGSLRVVADASGNPVKQIDYDSFGNVFSDSDPNFAVPFGFAGGLYDKDTELVRFGFRDYDPDTGRWTAKDPIGFAGRDTDLYGYCVNDPVNLADPSGLYIGQYPPPPPGYDSSTWTTGQWDNGKWYTESPDGRTYTVHTEDTKHWRHWDIQGPGGKDGGSWPPNPGKPWKGQKKLKPNQCDTDPSGNAPEWTPPFMPFFFPTDIPLDFNIPFRIPIIRVPAFAW